MPRPLRLSRGRDPHGLLGRCADCLGRAGCVLAELPASTREQFHAAAQFRIYGRGVSVFRQGDDPLGLFLMCTGWMKLVYLAPHGKAATVALAGPGTLVGLREVLTNDPYDVSAEVIETTELAYLRRVEFLRLVEQQPQVSLAMLVAVSRVNGGLLAELCENVAKLPSMDRLLHVLQNLARRAGRAGRQGTTISLPLTVQDLADRIGCSRQWTSRLLASLEDQGLIRRRHGWISLSAAGAEAAEAAGGCGPDPAGASEPPHDTQAGVRRRGLEHATSSS